MFSYAIWLQKMALVRLGRRPSIWLVVTCFTLLSAHGQSVPPPHPSMSTPERWKSEDWWPTKGTFAASDYTGPAACSQCHAQIAASQAKTPMFKALSRASDSVILKQRKQLQFSDETYNYALIWGPSETNITIRDNKGGTRAASAVLSWAFGFDSQTFVLKRDDSYLESRLSYFLNLKGLSITPGHSEPAPKTIEAAFGDPLDPEIARRCFGCHSTASTVSGRFDPEHAVAGVTCEACHGPGAKHVKAMLAGQDKGLERTTLNPQSLSPVDSVDFCGACHRSPVDVALFLPRHMGVSSVRMPAYRLERSMCWGVNGDERITCMACHDPHKPLVTESTSYDAKCLQCHAGQGRLQTAALAPACPRANGDCVSCHMQKYRIPWANATFTDHFIRVIRPDAIFPE